MKKTILAITIFIANTSYSGAFPYIFNIAGASTSAAIMLLGKMTYKDREAEITNHKIDHSVNALVFEYASQMPDVNVEDVKNMCILSSLLPVVDCTSSPRGELIHRDSNSTPILYLDNFANVYSNEPSAKAYCPLPRDIEIHDRQQYMILAHELGHFYHKDGIHGKQTHTALFLASGLIYPCMSRLVTSCFKNPYARAGIFPVALGASTIGYFCSCAGVNNYLRRQRERRADMFALRQARSLRDIDAFHEDMENHAYTDEHITRFLTGQSEPHFLERVFAHRPPARERAQYIADYYHQKVQEGWQE